MNKKLQELFREDELLDLAVKLVQIPGHAALPHKEKEVADFIFEVFRKEGIDVYLQPVEGERCNVIATLHGDGSKKSLMFNGHTDTVPVFGMEDPYGAHIRDGFMYGRGTCDMKCGIAAQMYALMLIHRAGIPLGGNLVFAGVIDEESASSKGSWHIAKHGPHTDYALVGEPSGLEPIVTHKGIDYFKIEFRGKAAHSSTVELGANALYAGADFISAVREQLIPLYKTMTYPYLGSASVNPSVIMGSAESNMAFVEKKAETFSATVPDICDFYLDIRWTPDQSVPRIMEDLNTIARQVAAKNPGVAVTAHYVPFPRPALPISTDTTLIDALTQSISTEIGPEKAVPTGGAFFTDAAVLAQGANIPSAVFGPGGIADGLHTIHERVPVSHIYDAARVYMQTALRICGKDA